MYPPVTKFYAGKSIFLTGGTGFLGKVILEKLLYSCLVEKIYVLVRSKKGVNAEQRIKNLVESPLFTRINRERFQDLGRIVPIVGDLGFHNLGLSKADEETLLNKVSVTFHAGASVKFDDPLKEALDQNVEGTRNVVDLCRRMKQIQDKDINEPQILKLLGNLFTLCNTIDLYHRADLMTEPGDGSGTLQWLLALVHISTAFCQADKEVVEEVVYPPPADLDDVYCHLEKYGEDKNKIKELLSEICHHPNRMVETQNLFPIQTLTQSVFTDGQLNTYTFSKALAETLVAERRGKVPTVIIRPSIVSATYHEPFPSWVDSWSAASLMLTFVAKGLVRTQIGHKSFVSDVIPVDYVTNLSIVAASRCSSSNEVTVYNCCTSDVNPLFFQDCFDLFTKEGLIHNFNDLPMPGFVFVTSKWIKSLLIFVLETAPANIMDFFSLIQGKNLKYVKLHKKISVIRDLCEPFIARSWLLTSQNTRDLATSLSSYDQKMFPFNPANIVWKDYVPKHFEGVKKYLMKRKKKNNS